MASETSSEAYVPVLLALFKLNLLFFVEDYFTGNKSPLEFFLQPEELFGEYWDIYLMTLLAGLMSLIYMVRRRV